MKTLRTAQPIFLADGTLQLKAPRSWQELTQEQLRYLLFLLATFSEPIEVKTFMFFRFTGIKARKKDRFGWLCDADGLIFTIRAEQVESLLEQFDYIDSYDNLGVRLDDINGCRAVDVLLHGVSFIDYLNAEKFYQLYQQTHDDAYIERMACILYRDADGDKPEKMELDKSEILGTLLWFAWIKAQLSEAFPNFFKPVGDKESSEDFDIVKSMNIQIRALTDGDITKEEYICNSDCWRALTELDFKAKAADDFEKKYNQKK